MTRAPLTLLKKPSAPQQAVAKELIAELNGHVARLAGLAPR
jgi:hypothetical protein